MAATRRFGGRVALVTGAASGIGRSTALRLAEEGAAVVNEQRVRRSDRDMDGARHRVDEGDHPLGGVACSVADRDRERVRPDHGRQRLREFGLDGAEPAVPFAGDERGFDRRAAVQSRRHDLDRLVVASEVSKRTYMNTLLAFADRGSSTSLSRNRIRSPFATPAPKFFLS